MNEMNYLQNVKDLSKEKLLEIEKKMTSLGMEKVDNGATLKTGQYKTRSFTNNLGIKTYQAEWLSSSDLSDMIGLSRLSDL